MDHSKLFFVLLFLVKTINSTKYNYCDYDILKLNKMTTGRRYFIPLDYKNQIIEEVNQKRNDLNKTMNYVNWDIELDKVALNLLKIITFYRPNSLGYIGCLVRTPLRNDLYFYGDSTRGTNESTVINAFKLTTRPKFYSFATEEQNITSMGCAIWIMVIIEQNGLKVTTVHLVCLFSGINGGLLEVINSNFCNLRGQNLTDTHYEYLEEKFGINPFDIYLMYILTGLTYSVIFLCYTFLICLKWYHKKALMSDDNYDWDGC